MAHAIPAASCAATSISTVVAFAQPKSAATPTRVAQAATVNPPNVRGRTVAGSTARLKPIQNTGEKWGSCSGATKRR